MTVKITQKGASVMADLVHPKSKVPFRRATTTFVMEGANGKSLLLRYEEDREQEKGQLDCVTATFTVEGPTFLPSDELSEAELEGKGAPRELLMAYARDSGDGEHTLVLEDSASNARLLGLMLEHLGYGTDTDPAATFRALANRSTFKEGFALAFEQGS